MTPAAQSADPETPFRHVLPNGRLQEPGVSEADTRTATLCHVFVTLGALSGVLLIVVPILWLSGSSRSAFIDDHGREACNFTLSMLLFSLLLAISVVGLALLWVPWLLMIVLSIRSATIASNREYVRYPMTIRIL
jgi:uncharacterized Tic20 family protein